MQRHRGKVQKIIGAESPGFVFEGADDGKTAGIPDN